MVSLDDRRSDAHYRRNDVRRPARTVDCDLGANRLRRHRFVYHRLDRAHPRTVEARSAATAQAGQGVADCAGHFCEWVRCACCGLPQGEILLAADSARTPRRGVPTTWRNSRMPLRMGTTRKGRRSAADGPTTTDTL